jgi:hypothetical protein
MGTVRRRRFAHCLESTNIACLFAQAIHEIQNAIDEPNRVVFTNAEAKRLGLSYPTTNAAVLPLVEGWRDRNRNDCLSARGAERTLEGRLIAQRLTLAESRADRNLAASCFCAQAAEPACCAAGS